MTELNFPHNPTNGQEHDGYIWNATKGVWDSNSGLDFNITDLADVDTTGVVDGNALVYDGVSSQWIPGAGGSGGGSYTISAIPPAEPGEGDVWFNSETARSYIYYVDADTAQWVEIGGSEGAPGSVSALDSVSDVNVGSVQDGDALVYDSATGTWVPGEAGGKFTVSDTAPAGAENGDTWFKSDDGKTYIYYVDADGGQWVEIASNTTGYLDIGQLNDVTIVSPTTGQALTYDGSGWVNATPASTVGSLTDTTISTPLEGQALVYDSASGNWINAAAAGGVEISATAPVAPSPGDLWFNSTQAKVYVYYDDGDSAQWVSAIGGLASQSGTDGQFLIHDGTEWVASALASSNMPTGSVLQVVSTTKTDTFSTTSSSYTAVTGLSASITPSSTSNKILVSVSIPCALNDGANSNRSARFTLFKDGSNLLSSDTPGSRLSGFGGISQEGSTYQACVSYSYLDSPATASAVTYDVRIATTSASATVYVNRDTDDADDSGHQRGVATITLMEVAG